jgi:hypothetical protein
VQVDPIKLTLKAPGIKLLKLKYDNKPLSNFAFRFNFRRYIQELLRNYLAKQGQDMQAKVRHSSRVSPREAASCTPFHDSHRGQDDSLVPPYKRRSVSFSFSLICRPSFLDWSDVIRPGKRFSLVPRHLCIPFRPWFLGLSDAI